MVKVIQHTQSSVPSEWAFSCTLALLNIKMDDVITVDISAHLYDNYN